MPFKIEPKKGPFGGTYYEVKEPDSDAAIALAALFAVIAFIVFNAHWILMGIGGATGTWLAQKITRKSIDEYINDQSRSDTSSSSVVFIVIMALIGGGFGFVQGNSIKTYFEKPTQIAEESSSQKTSSQSTIPTSYLFSNSLSKQSSLNNRSLTQNANTSLAEEKSNPVTSLQELNNGNSNLTTPDSIRDFKDSDDPCEVWKSANPALAASLSPGDSCY